MGLATKTPMVSKHVFLSLFTTSNSVNTLKGSLPADALPNTQHVVTVGSECVN